MELDKNKVNEKEIYNKIGFHVDCGKYPYKEILNNYDFILGNSGTIED